MAGPADANRGHPGRWLRLAALFALTGALIFSSLVLPARPAEAVDPLVLRVGLPDEMKTRNPLSPIFIDVWTVDVLFRIYDFPLKILPDGAPAAYIGKGVDVDEDGLFEAGEYGTWREQDSPASRLEIVVYYDFNGVRWHDGTQMTVWDLLFSYHLNAMGLRWNADLQVLFAGGPRVSYEGSDRQLNLTPFDVDPAAPGFQRNWEGEGSMAGDPSLRWALRFTLTEPFPLFYETVLVPVLFPMHVWSRTGGGRHADFGCGIWIPPGEATAKGLPECAATDAARWGKGIAAWEPVAGSSPYRYALAESWAPRNEDVIGSGPFRSLSWTPGEKARVERYDAYYVGEAYDARLASVLRRPHITAIEFLVYPTEQLAVFALRSGEMDFYHWTVDPGFVPDLLRDPAVRVEGKATHRILHMGYNMRREPWGYRNGTDFGNDTGRVLRLGIAHAIDRNGLVNYFQGGLGYGAWGWVSPSEPFWHNDRIRKPAFDLDLARAILDSPETLAVGVGPDPPGDCSAAAPQGCRTLPRVGTGTFGVLTFQAPDPTAVPTPPGALIADALRRVGLNAASEAVPFLEFLDRLERRDFDMFLYSTRFFIPTLRLWFDAFSCDATPFVSDIGYCNPEFDRLLEDAGRETDRDRRRDLFLRAQEILAEDRPGEPVYFRTTLEAFREDRLTGWVSASSASFGNTFQPGTVWNEWSLFRLRPPGSDRMHVSVTAAPTVAAGDAWPLAFSVRDGTGKPISAATVTVTLEAATGESPGILRVSGQAGTAVTVTTDAGGRAAATYEAPRFYESTRPILVKVSAVHPDFDEGASDETVITVFGGALPVLQIRIDLPGGDIANPGTPLPVRLEVRGAGGEVVGDASVAFRAEPSGVVLPASGSSVDLQTMTVSFPAPGIYTVAVNATKAGYSDGSASVTVWVVEPMPPPQPPVPPAPVEDPRVLIAFGAGLLVAAVSSVVVLWWRTRRGPRRN